MAPADFVFAHLADAHVGAWPRDPTVRRALRNGVLEALQVAADRRAEFLLVSGDLFHTPVPEPAEVAPVADRLRELAARGVRIYVIFGSHDYVAHRTGWLDVLAAAGLFVKVAPEAVRVEGARWRLPFLVDPPTGAAISGISGRSHGLDREYYRSLDASEFRAHVGFKIFMFHAAVLEYLPPGLRDHIRGIARDDLPAGVDYYAGGHIHWTYTGEGPAGGLLVNPGAVFGTSVTDVENAARGRTHQGLALVTVRGGVARAEFVDTTARNALSVFDIDLTGKRGEEARMALRDAVDARAAPGILLFPRIRGVADDVGAAGLGLKESGARAEAHGATGIRWEVQETAPVVALDPTTTGGEHELEEESLRALEAGIPGELVEFADARGAARLRELLRELGTPPGDGEARQDYASARVRAALGVLGLERPTLPAEGG